MQNSKYGIAFSRTEVAIAWRLLLLFCLLYIYELANFNITIDDEILAQSGTCHFADLGRWVYPLLRATLWPLAVLPSGPLLLFGCAFAVSSTYITRLFGITRFGLFHYVAFAAYAIFPTWFAQLEFGANVLPDALGVLAVTYAALLTSDTPAFGQRWCGWRLIGAVAGCTVAFGAYQSLGLMYLALVVSAELAARIGKPQPTWSGLARTTARALLVLVLGFVFSSMIGRLVMLACHMTPSAYGISSLHFDEALRHPLRALELGVREISHLYLSFWYPFGRQVGWTYMATILLCCATIMGLAAPGVRKWIGGVLLILLMIPASLSVAGANQMAVRTFFAGPVVLLSLLLMAHRQCRSPTLRRGILVLALLCAMQGLYIKSVQQAREWVVTHHDLVLASAINTEIMRLQDTGDNGPIYVNFRGVQAVHSDYPLFNGSVATGISFFEWGDGNIWRIVAYMNFIGYNRLRAYPEDPPGAFDQEYAKMPIWPAPGSVERFGNGYLVKLSEPPASGK
jgi:hypothetical protein